MRIAVIGCGIAGPAAAVLLARAGHAVEIFERSPTLGPVGAGILIQPPGMAVLRRLGCGDEVMRLGGRVRRLSGYRPDGRVVLDLPFPEDGRAAVGIHRGCLFGMLHAMLPGAGVVVQTDADVARVVGDVVELAGGERVGGFDLVVVADGANARTICAGWREEEPRAQRWGAWWMSLPDPGRTFPETLHQIYAGPSKLMGVLPTGISEDGTTPSVSVFWGIRMDRAEAWRAAGVAACRREMLTMDPRMAGMLEGLREVGQMTLARYYDRLPRRWSRGRVVLIGDAAHAMSPHLGQGANLALQDAAGLADAVEGEAKLEVGLRRYWAARFGHVRMYSRFSRWMTPFFQSDRAGIAAARDLGMPVVTSVPWMRERTLRVLRGEVRRWRDLV